MIENKTALRGDGWTTRLTASSSAGAARYPWDGLDRRTMPGFWLFASLGKRVLRPGGIALTKWMLEALSIGPEDDVVEYAPGMGVTARLTLARNPRSYAAVERDARAVALLRNYFNGAAGRCCLHGDAVDPLPFADGSATVVYGESMLTIHPDDDKERILREVYRVLRPGGRFAMQEISILPENTPAELGERIRRELVRAVCHPARPQTTVRWREVLEERGFTVMAEAKRPVHLLEPCRLLEDEGAEEAIGFLANTLMDPVASDRVRRIRALFERYGDHLCGYCCVCRKPE